jgi:hypothetical protein
MSRILRRPMFRGGRVSSYGTGIASGLADGGMPPKRGLVDGPGGYAGYRSASTYDPTKYKFYDVGSAQRITDFIPQSAADLATFQSRSQWEVPTMQDIEDQIQSEIDARRIGIEGSGQISGDMLPESFLETDEGREQRRNELIAERAEKIEKMKEFGVVVPGEGHPTEGLDLTWGKPEKIEEVVDTKTETFEDEFGNLHQRTTGDDIIEEKDTVMDDEMWDIGDPPPPEATDVSLSELADEYYRQLKGERGERDEKRIKKARGQDISDWLLKYSEQALDEGATALGAAGKTAGWISERPSRTEIIQEKITDKDDTLREAGAQIAITEKIGDKKLDKTFANQLKLMDKRVQGTVAAALAGAKSTDFDKIQSAITDPNSSAQVKSLAFTKLGLSGNFTSQVNAIMNKHQRNVGDVEALDLANTYFGAFNDGKPIIVVDVIDLKKDGIQVDKTNKKIVLIKDGAYKIIGDYSGG